MVKFALIVSTTPKEISKRKTRLMDAYNNIVPDSSNIVSVKMRADLERIRESNIDSEDDEMRCKIIEQLIEDYTESNFSVPKSNDFKTFLIPTVTSCLKSDCDEKALIICRPSRTENSVPVFTVSGVLEGEVYRKVCSCCKSIYYYNYYEHICDKDQLMRTYYPHDPPSCAFFSTTNESFFEAKLLENLSEEVVTCNVQFVNWATCYNRLNSNDTWKVSGKLVIPAWLIFSIWKRIIVEFPVIRDKFRNLDIEAVLAHLYPRLRLHIDNRWHHHICSRCSTRLVVMDGDAKAYRTVCSFDPEKIIRKGELNEFLECAASPLPGKDRCSKHLDVEKNPTTEERIDFGMMTRSKRKELGVHIDMLTTEEG